MILLLALQWHVYSLSLPCFQVHDLHREAWFPHHSLGWFLKQCQHALLGLLHIYQHATVALLVVLIVQTLIHGGCSWVIFVP